MKEKKENTERHLGFNAKGDELIDLGIEHSVEEKIVLPEDKESANFAKRDCTILYWNGAYQKPNVSITGGRISVSLGRNVQRIQLRHIASGAIRYYVGGTYNIPNGDYVLSLWGSTYPHEYIIACISYN